MFWVLKKFSLHRKLDGPNFEQLTVPDLVQLEKQLNAKISQIRARKGAFHDQENHAYVLGKLQPSDILHLGLGSPYRNDDGIQNDPPKYGIPLPINLSLLFIVPAKS
ncbi:hypothetical protein Patl1_16964 [Pistacia atlantica]|uniref:Uncharacterized protein n=1 Tax=Pistacia atlantica TaxID=434234 RepID=A0ACC1B5K6_9ROSI|nr:hypothetical protein Patl1_16964 [Pistacia atlantica]